MIYEISRHKLAYTILLLILGLHVLLYFATWPNMIALRLIAISLAFSYCCWGILAHVKSRHVTKQIVREYVAVSVFAGAILLLLTL